MAEKCKTCKHFYGYVGYDKAPENAYACNNDRGARIGKILTGNEEACDKFEAK